MPLGPPMSLERPLAVECHRFAKNSSALGGYFWLFFWQRSRKNQREKASPNLDRPSAALSNLALLATSTRHFAYQVGKSSLAVTSRSPPPFFSAVCPASIAAGSMPSS